MTETTDTAVDRETKGSLDSDGGRLTRKFVRTIARRPCLVCWSSLCGAFFLVVIICALVAGGVFELAIDTSPSSMKVTHDSIADRADAFSIFMDDTTTGRGVEGSAPCDIGTCDSSGRYYQMQWLYIPMFYEAKGGASYRVGGVPGANVFTEGAAREIREFETDVYDLTSFNKVCLQTMFDGVNKYPCRPPSYTPSAISFASSRGAVSTLPCCSCNATALTTCSASAGPLCANSNGSYVNFYAPDGLATAPSAIANGVMDLLYDATSCDELSIPNAASLKRLVDNNFYDENERTSRTTRSLLLFGGVVDLEGVPVAEQWDHVRDVFVEDVYPRFEKFVIDEMIPLMDDFNAAGDVRVSAFSGAHLKYEIVNLGLVSSVRWMIASLFVTWGYMVFHTKSYFLSSLGIVHILISFPVTFFFYTAIFQIKYMGFLNFMSLFIILGIGADDVFVYVDAWKQTATDESPDKSVEGRLYRAHTRAFNAMFITSLTDGAAFYANAFSSITVIRIFGVFTGTLVFTNFFLVVTYFPAVIVLWHKYGFDTGSLACSRVGSPRSAVVPTAQDDDDDNDAKPDSGRRKKRQCMEIFCSEKFAPTFFSTKTRAAAVIFASLAVTFGFLAIALQLEQATVDFKAQSFPEDATILQALECQGRFDGAASSVRFVAFVLGLGDDASDSIDRSNADPNNPTEIGDVVYLESDTFQTAVSSVAGQEHLLRICQKFRENSKVYSYIQDPRDAGVACWVEHFRAWLDIVDNGTTSFPVPPHSFVPLLERFVAVSPTSNTSCILGDSDCYAYHQSAASYPSSDTPGWRWGGWGNALRFSKRDGSLKGMVYAMNVSMDWDATGARAREVFDVLEETQNVLNAAAPSAALKGFQVAYDNENIGGKWTSMRTEEVIFQAAVVGCAVSTCVAFFILTVATGNYVLASLATVAIVCTINSCLAFMQLAGWTIGFIECVCIVICVGFSIDYSAHLAIAYNESPTTATRFERLRQALGELGISVTAAAITTCCAAMFMLPNRMTPFKRIGAFIAFDVAAALFFAVGLFVALLRLAGPVENQGNLRVLFEACRDGIKKHVSPPRVG